MKIGIIFAYKYNILILNKKIKTTLLVVDCRVYNHISMYNARDTHIYWAWQKRSGQYAIIIPISVGCWDQTEPEKLRHLMYCLDCWNQTTIIISSHILRELAEFCTSIGFLKAGAVLDSGRVSGLLAKYQNPVATYQVKIIEKANRALDALRKCLNIQEAKPFRHCKNPKSPSPGSTNISQNLNRTSKA